ncbi:MULTISPECIES: carbohydrate ABC transporter permease [Geobacillus]|jgi:multiple sugar transport system permease protein|uniref:Sugar ABC transporter permease n=1 Tax=Geobacillus thermodenitrificans TaxID=33940 RepID=A0ABY9QE09_GEOTD|nr:MULTISPECIES: sugar ABC transporter permease [Geobacillus]ARP41933.1 Lactose transport system permease protein LacF [Geobacillus thermodenitrificans]ATO36704.1 sugar ABC transporter permease [Geobacillus thermodenitrificans]KQB94149.1 sugar ABC transporter permease [Geobacillus sp. PA-3]MEC5188322.1 multiple sugar transport system permease protein [Geobacillus thermodenitrificans]MED3716549.1 sugar ABC transporter permease [Geobacillus thermodenitrificans]
MKQTFTKKMWRETGSAYFLLSPALFVLLLFIIGPIVFAVFLAFHKVQLLGTTSFEFVGLDNFVRIANDTRAKIALWNTLKYVAIVVPCQTILALVLAATLNAGLKGQKFFRIVYFLPTLTSSAVLTLIFMWMYNQNGFINHVLEAVGLPTYNWLGDPDVALNAIMIMNIWSTAPYFMVIYLAALQDIPDSLYEAAELDGANAWQKFWHITVPYLRPVTSFVVVMGLIGTFQLFDQSYIFSAGSGGPNNSTLTVVLLIYQYAFKTLGTMGYAAALAFALAIIILIATLIQRKLSKEESLY